jgi:hypothetical protein
VERHIEGELKLCDRNIIVRFTEKALMEKDLPYFLLTQYQREKITSSMAMILR